MIMSSKPNKKMIIVILRRLLSMEMLFLLIGVFLIGKVESDGRRNDC